MQRSKKSTKPTAPSSVLAACALGLVFFVSAAWGMLNFVAFLPDVVISADLDNYRPARFVVAEVVYRKYRKGGYSYYAKGQIEGEDEEFEFSTVAPVLPNLEALEQHFAQQPVSFAVMYNPNRARSMVNGTSLRMRPAQPGFVERYRSATRWAIFNVLISLIVAVTAGLFLRRIGKHSPGKQKQKPSRLVFRRPKKCASKKQHKGKIV